MSPLLKIEKHKHPEKIVVYFEAKLNDIAYKGSISWRWWAIFIPAANMVAGIKKAAFFPYIGLGWSF